MGVAGSKDRLHHQNEVIPSSPTPVPSPSLSSSSPSLPRAFRTPCPRTPRVDTEDPRSPSLHFERTPLESAVSAPTSPITKSINLNKECFDKFESLNLDSPSVRNILNDFDPRSPALDFQRTPLAFMLKNPALMSEYNRTERLKHVQNDSIISNDLFETEVPKPGLLETNLDVEETDIDEARKIRRSMVATKPISDEDKEKDPRSPSEGINRTPILITEDTVKETETDEIDEQVKELQKVNQEISVRHKNSFNRNTDSVIIYEDDATDIVLTPIVPKIANIQTGEKTRTPLSCVINTDKSRNNTPLSTYDLNGKSSAKSRSGGKSKIPIKIQNASSKKCEMRKILLDKVPVSERRLADAENSPPIVRKACWDHNNTVVL